MSDYRLNNIVVIAAIIAACVLGHGRARAAERPPVDFGRDIRPILSNRCYKCHGPDSSERQAGLRLDDRGAALSEADSGEVPLVPGDAEASEIYRRLVTDDADERMPPTGDGEPLTEEEIETLRRWIAEGGEYAPHWAFVAPTRPQRPATRNSEWPRGAIDSFVLNKIESAGQRPSPPADRRVLVRRVYLDLIGIPPTFEEVEAFVTDESDSAYERVVDRLLASPRYGERMAQDWLDLARYSDTTGYAADSPRPMWLFRDWVIKALNDNMPFDQFTIEQLAGDMLPNATDDQKIATGFHRNSMQALGNNPRKEEFRVKGIVDRVNTTGRTWLGLTVSCAECHEHKYDPISQAEYYRLFAIFNNIPHYGKAFGVRGPRIDAITPLAAERKRQIDGELTELKSQITPYDAEERASRFANWHTGVRQQVFRPEESTPAAPLMANWPLDGDLNDISESPVKSTVHGGDMAWAEAAAIRRQHALRLEDQQYVRVTHHEKLSPAGDMTISAWIQTRSEKADIVCKWDSVRGQRSFVFGIGGEGEQNATPGHLYAWLSGTKEYFSGQQIYGSIPVHDGQWHHVALVFHAGDRAELYVDGKRDLRVRRSGEAPEQLADATCDLVLGGGYSLKPDPSSYSLDGLLADVRLYGAAVERAATLGAVSPTARSILTKTSADWTAEERTQLHEFFDTYDPGRMTDSVRDRIGVLTQELAFLDRPHQAQIMLEMEQPRSTHVHVRGDYLSPGEEVAPGVPAFLATTGDSPPTDRLAFARWLADRKHPLTARVTVNRIWQHYFGTGIVRTADDFGLQGEWPSHPNLLDWLAVEFVESGWDMKALHRQIVTSATYRQSASAPPAAFKNDPANRLLARGSRYRLPAEQVRDQALAISGLLSTKLGGPSVHPEQPAGLFEEKAQTMYHPTWVTSTRSERYRRGVYVYWKRMNLYPSMAIFDAPTRERCRVQRAATNTPIQALVLLNDPVYVEAARALASEILAHAADETTGIDDAIRRCMARAATSEEIARYGAFLERQRKRYRDDTAAAQQLLSAASGDEPSGMDVAAAELDPVEHAAWTVLASVLLNLDETITKP